MTAEARADARWGMLDEHLLEDFAAYQRAKNLADTTIRNRASILRTLQRTLDGSLTNATLAELRAYVGRPGIKAGSRRTTRNALKSFYAFLLDEGYSDTDPTARLQAVNAPKGEPRPFTAEQIDRMLTSGAYARTRIMIMLGYYQGFRVSSIARVHGKDIDLDSMTIRTIGKGGKERTLPLHTTIAAIATTMPSDRYWFPARGGREGPIHPSSVTDRITRAKHRAGITDPRLTPHSLRHAFGTDLVEAHVDIRVVQELMMHESLATTQIYTGVSERRKREGITTLAVRNIPTKSGRSAAPLDNIAA